MYGLVREIHDTKNSEIDIKTLDFPFSPRGFLAATDMMAYLDNFDIKSDIFVYAKLEHQFLYRRLGWEEHGDCRFLLPTTGTDVPYSLQTFVRRGIINMVSAVAAYLVVKPQWICLVINIGSRMIGQDFSMK